MMKKENLKFTNDSIWVQTAASFILCGTAFLLTGLLWELVKPLSSPLFLGAIILSAWFFGLRAGILTSILSAAAIDFFFISPAFQISGGMDNVFRLAVFIGEGAILSWLISSRKSTVEKLENSQAELRALSIYQQTLRETEQKRIALEIHDELGQALTGLKMDVHWLNRQMTTHKEGLPADSVSQKLTELSKTIDSTISTVRRISTELRPSIIDDFGLIAAIEWQTREFERKSGVTCLFKSDTETLNLNPESTINVFRIFQETLTNIIRHADASTVEVNFETTGENVVMRVEDNGRGIDVRKAENGLSLGIFGMKERAKLINGEIQIISDADGGTKVELKIPVAA